ncbi:MAG: A/G-specific adenine glycosylase [Phycisphaerales bacterium]
MTISRDRARRISSRIESWFAQSARAFPWRPTGDGARDAYVSLVSEIMLQQTQAARVAERLPVFLERFPDVSSLAGASEDDVLHAWQGLGYYRRARSLHGAASMIEAEFDGVVPRDVASLRSLPGVGAYTAGAIASMAYGLPEACVDGNIQRVIMRTVGIDLEPDAPGTKDRVWDVARTLVGNSVSPGALNEGLMELGAVVCTPPPHSPSCGECPLARLCVARREGRQQEIPRPKSRSRQRVIFHDSVVVAHPRLGLRVEQRPDAGLWQKMWQPITHESDSEPAEEAVLAWSGLKSIEERGSFEHKTTHRVVKVRIWSGSGVGRGTPGEWADRGRLGELAMSNAARRVIALGGDLTID